MTDFGANPALAKAEPVARLGPSGFDPGEFKPDSYDRKPRHMPKAERKELNALVEAARDHLKGLTPYRRRTLLRGFLSVSQVNCSWQHFGLAEMFVYELGALVNEDLARIEAGTDETPQAAQPVGREPDKAPKSVERGERK